MIDQINSQVNTKEFKKATFGGGCFWCTEAVFKQIDGVISTEVGYAGGHTENPTYEQVCTGKTGHAEVCQVVFDPEKITYDELLEIFFKTHDPTTLNRQGADIGTQYRSVIFYHDEEQKNRALSFISKLQRSGKYENQIVTQVEALNNYYRAEEYHQNYFEKNPYAAYCVYVVAPKVDKTKKLFKEKIKKH
ncbi:MAG: peptide-methionine (S)-S-oxide reductase MsrA [Ignavibacteria bacterium]